jgi:hypothetical protein
MAKTKLASLVFAAASADRTLTWPCTIAVPQDGGGVVEQKLDCSFKVPTPERIDRFYAGIAPSISSDAPNAQLALLDEFLTGFPGLKNAAGEDVPFETAKAAFVAMPFVVSGIVNGLIAMAQGREAKNS